MVATPYITPDYLRAAPTGIAWGTIPDRSATIAQQTAELANICWRATHTVDGICNQVLRATVDTETHRGPDYRVTVDASGVGRIQVTRWPVLELLGASVSPAANFPRSWTTYGPAQLDSTPSMAGVYGSSAYGAGGTGPMSVMCVPGMIDWAAGRNGYLIHLAYVNGWPHSSLTASVNAGSASVSMDDCTGMTGALLSVYDGADTETVTVLSTSASTGPGVATLSAPVVFPHPAGVLFTTLPQSVLWATVLLAVSQALTRGATATTVQRQPGTASGSGKDPAEMATEAEILLAPYRRVI